MAGQGGWIFILGCQRSGTTLTGQILGAHSRCLLIDEPDGLYTIFNELSANKPLDHGKLTSTIDKAKKKYTDIRRHLDNSIILNQYRLIAKAPNLTYEWNALASRNDNPIVLYPVRDVRSVVASMLELKRIPMVQNQINRILNNPELLEECSNDIQILTRDGTPEHVRAALVWKIKTGLYRKFQDVGLSPHIFKYENLIVDQIECIAGIARHCNLAFQREIMHYYQVMEGTGPGNTLRKRSIDGRSLSKWETQLSEEQVNEILDIGATLMTELGYEICVERRK